ncbi:putative ATP-dependent RNA helicase DHX40 [Glandiceps talaboti]
MAAKNTKFKDPDRKELPIFKFKDEILKTVEKNQCVVIIGETGSGKTTQLPQFLYKKGYGNHGMIGVTQPRRVAAISVASRVAEEQRCTLGQEVGYQVRFDDITSKNTVIKYMTDGCLLREFLDDQELSKYSVIILDEAHERSLHTDILFGLMKDMFLSKRRKSSKRRQPLKVIIMSATLDADKISEFWDNCKVFKIPGRLYPVKNIFCNLLNEEDVKNPNYESKVVKVVMDIHLDQPQGDILVFLTGQVEIEKACDNLFKKAENLDYKYDVSDSNVTALLIVPVYGSMPTESQRRIFTPAEPGVRKCVVATNIAGTSLTIDGIRYVVDSGFVKQLSFNPRTGLDTLQVVPISRSEAIQRSGRAGRTAAGKCYRIYTKDFYNNVMTENMTPEIQRTSLTMVVLNLKCMGIHDVLGFHYVDPPEERMLLEALRQLYYFQAIDKDGHITRLGHLMVDYPLSPGLSKAVIQSGRTKCSDVMLAIAAMLSVENILIRPGEGKKQIEATKIHTQLANSAGGVNDFATLLYIYQECKESESPRRWCSDHYIHWRAVKMAFSIYQQLDTILQRQVQSPDFPEDKTSGNDDELLRRCLCIGYFHNVARKSVSGRGFVTMDGHGTPVFIHPASVLFGKEDRLDWILYHEVIWTSKVYLRTVCPVRYEWIKDLLPRLHELDVYALSGCLKMDNKDETEQERALQRSKDTERDRAYGDVNKASRRNTDSSIADARRRYLERKQAKTGT